MNEVISNDNQVEVLGQTGTVDAVSNENESQLVGTIETAPVKKGITMNLKTLFILGIGSVILICGIVALILLLIGKKYTVSFDTDGGSKIASVKVRKGKTVEKPKDPTKEDYTFVEWQLDGKTYDFTDKVTKNIKLKAVWEIELTDDVYTITFNTYGGSEIENQSVNGNGKVTKPEDPVRTHSRFVEWQLDGEPYDFDSLVKKDITLEAVWTSMPSHDVTFDFDGGGKNYAQVVYEGDTIDKPEDPVKEGYKFIEWRKDNQKYDFNTPVISDITLKAKWEEAKQYTVTFDSNGGTPVSSQRWYEGSTANKPTDPTRTNYSFGGWQLDGKDYDFNTKLTKDITLIAKWEEVKTCKVDIYDYVCGIVDECYLGTIKIKCGTKITVDQINDICIKKNYPANCGSYSWSIYDQTKPVEIAEVNPEKFDLSKPVNKDYIIFYFFGKGAM